MWGAVFALTRYVSIASMAAAVAIPLAQLARRYPAGDVWLGVFLAVLIIARHRTNVQRLMAGAEHRAGSR